MNARSLSLVLAALLLTSPALAAPRRSAKQRASTTSTSTSTSTSSSSSATTADEPAPSTAATQSAPLELRASEEAPPPRRSAAPMGTGHLYAGGYVGLLVGGSVSPNLGLQVAGPIRLQGLPSNIHLEWLGALDFAFSSESESMFGAEVDASAFNVGLLPGARIVVPLAPQVLLHGDLSLGLAFSHASVTTRFNGNEANTSESEVGVVFRAAAGAIIPVNERLRFNLTPLALQTYSNGGTSYSIQAGLSFALD